MHRLSQQQGDTSSPSSPLHQQQSRQRSSFNRASLASTDEVDDYGNDEDHTDAILDEETLKRFTKSSSYHSALGDDSASSFRAARRRQSSSSNQSSIGSITGKTRRPSSSSHYSSVSQNSSQAVHPVPRPASRSKILASSALSLENTNVASSLYGYRIRSGSTDRNIMTTDASTPLPPLPTSPGNARIPVSSQLANGASRNQSNASTSTISINNVSSIAPVPSIAERKRRLNSASASSASGGERVRGQRLDVGGGSIAPQRSVYTRASNSSLLLPPEAQASSSKDEIKTTKAEEDKAKPSLRSRLFGLRRSMKDASEGPVDASDAASIASVATSTDYGKEPTSGQPYSKESPLKLRIESVTNGRSPPPVRKELLSPSSATAAGRPKMESRMTSDASKETSNSWITSLTNVSPPTMPDFDALQVSPISMSRGNSGEALSLGTPSPRAPLMRTISWPASGERKGSFVALQGSGSGKGFRFENAAANQTRTSPVPPEMASTAQETTSGASVTSSSAGDASSSVVQEAASSAVDIPVPNNNALQITSSPIDTPSPSTPSFLNVDPSPSLESPPPVERREKSRPLMARSPPPSETEISLPGRRLRGHARSDSNSSIQSMQSYRNPHSRPRMADGSKRRSHYRTSSTLSQSWQDGLTADTTASDKRDKGRSPTAFSPTGMSTSPSSSSTTAAQSLPLMAQSPISQRPISETDGRPPLPGTQSQPPVRNRYSSYGSPPSPVIHLPRSSSLHGKTANGTISRASSTTNGSYQSVGSPTETIDEFMQPKNINPTTIPGTPTTRAADLAAGIGAAGVAAGASVVATLARLKDLGSGERVLESKGDLATVSSVDTLSTRKSRDDDSGTSLSVDAPRPVERKANQLVPGEEPKRPTKSPLRKRSATVIKSVSSQSLASARTSPIKTKPDSGQRVATPGKEVSGTHENQITTPSVGQSPPRPSLEDVAQLRAIASNHFIGVVESKAYEPVTSEVMAVPESAKRLVDVTRSEYPLTHASTTSLTTSLAPTEDEQIAAPRMSDSKTQTLKKAKVPALATAFSRAGAGPTGSRASSMVEQPAEDEMEEAGSPAIMSKKKTKKWPFASKDLPGEGGESERRAPSMGTKVAKSLRGRKSEPQASRPLIRRVYDGTQTDDGHDEMARVASNETTVLHSPSIASRGEFRDSPTQSSPFPSLDSGPGTPITASEEMRPEVKKLVRRRNVIRELVETERSYSSDLAVVRDIYLARAKAVVGLSTTSTLQTPMSGFGTPTIGTPTSLAHFGSKSSPLHYAHRNVQRMASSELKLPPSSPVVQHSTASPSSFASSSEPSNRSSTYTVSSQTSQASDSSFPFNASSAPPMPATPPGLASLSSTNSGNTLHAPSPSSLAAYSTSRNATSKPKMQVSTTSLPMHSSTPVHTPTDAGFTVTDLRVMFAHLDACCSFAEDMSSVLAGCMGTFARSKRIDAAEVTTDMDKEDDRLGETFLQLMPRIRTIYIEYCSRHEAGMMRLQEVIAASPKASSFFKECTEVARKHTHAWDLASLLIKPVQRVLKYPLLIQQIVNSTSKSHPDYLHLSQAFDEIQAVADEINQVKRRKDLAETIITGRVKESRNVLASTSTLKGKKKSEIFSEDVLLTPFGGEEAALQEYTLLLKQFQAMQGHVAQLAAQCTGWTVSLRDTYEGQIKVMRAMRRTYRLQLEEMGPDGVLRAKVNKEALKTEERLIARYVKLLQTILAEPWRQVDRNVRLTMLPLVVKITDLFESPQLVVLKRDERQADYQRYRYNLLAGKQSERKVLESANGFIALNAQLVEELPLFLQGVQALLEVAVRTFARLQAAHFEEIRNQTLAFWKDVAKKSDEVVVDEAGLLSMRSINPVRVFWNRHSVSAAWIDSLGLIQRDHRGTTEEGDSSSASSTPGLQSVARMTSGLHISDSVDARSDSSAPTLKRMGSSNSALNDGTSTNYASNSYLHTSTPARRPTMVGNIMRSISGSFNRDSDGEVVPPLPADAASRHLSASTTTSKFSTAPMLPNLTFKESEGESGYFVQTGPVAFLDTMEKEVSKQPYESSPSEHARSLSSHEEILATSQHARSASNHSAISVQANEVGRATMLGEGAPQRQRMNVLYICVAINDSGPIRPDRSHLGWPFVAFVKGDTMRVLSSSDSAATPLIFGRIDRSGELGWAEKRCF